MQGQKYWIARGQLVPEPAAAASQPNEMERIHRGGAVRILTGPAGTELRWAVFAPNIASLYFAMEWLRAAKGPFILRYFLAGWFEETFTESEDAVRRLEVLIAKCDIHLTSRTYVKEAPIGHPSMPQLLRAVLQDGGKSENDYSVDCVFEEAIGRFRVERIGSRSAIAKFYGHSAVPFPCVNGGSYDDAVSAAYSSVVKTGLPRYDHVYSAMSAPDGSVVWIPYQRIILPRYDRSGKPSVTVTSEISKVDIQIV